MKVLFTVSDKPKIKYDLKPKNVFKNDKCSYSFAVIGFDNEVICYLPCGRCDSCKEVRSKNRSRKNGKGKKTN